MKRLILSITIGTALLCADALQLHYIGEAVGEQRGGNGGAANNPGRVPEKPDRKRDYHRLNEIPDLLIGAVVHLVSNRVVDAGATAMGSSGIQQARGGERVVGGHVVGDDGHIVGGI